MLKEPRIQRYKNSNIRGNGDDGLAIWSSISDGTNAAAEENNKFLNNTIESGWRAAGIGIFGGKGHEISGNLIKDVFAGAGIRRKHSLCRPQF
ncbi:MAG: hypothetical protein ACLRSA_04425 [Streptococcus salivarius]